MAALCAPLDMQWCVCWSWINEMSLLLSQPHEKLCQWHVQHISLFSSTINPISLRPLPQLCVVMIFLVTVVMCRGIISVMMFHTGSPVLRTEVCQSYKGTWLLFVLSYIYTCECSRPQAGTIANISSSIVNLGLILLMGRVYTALAEQLTKWGKNHLKPQWCILSISLSANLQ